MKKQKGFIALTSILVLSAVLLSVVVGSVSRSIAGMHGSTAEVTYETARGLAHACTERALIELLRTFDYNGEEEMLFEKGACAILTITDNEGGGYLIPVESTAREHTYRYLTHVRIEGSEIDIVSQRPTDSF